MKVILFGGSGMVGQGVLRECLIDPGVETVLSVGRSPLGVQHPKLREIVHKDFTDYSAIESATRRLRRLLLLPRRLLDRHGRRALPASDLRRHHGGGDNAGAAQPRHGLHLRHRPRHQLHRTRPADVGAGEGQDRERSAEAAVQGRLHVPSRRHPAAAWRAFQDRLDQRGLRRHRAAAGLDGPRRRRTT